MKQYIIVCRYRNHPHATVLNGAIFSSKSEAQKAADYNELKYNSERKLSSEFWKEPISEAEPISKVVEINIPDTFYQD